MDFRVRLIFWSGHYKATVHLCALQTSCHTPAGLQGLASNRDDRNERLRFLHVVLFCCCFVEGLVVVGAPGPFVLSQLLGDL